MLAFLLIIFRTSGIELSDTWQSHQSNVENAIDSYFISESVLKVISLAARFKINDALQLERRSLIEVARSW